jgi:uncharacterized membrane protein YraQ (UPF0718 family)
MDAANIDIALPAVRRRNFGTVLAVVAALAIALVFWTQQRYPALTKKLHAGAQVQVKGSISFDAVLPVDPAMPVAERVGRTAVNWMWTNRFGMYFALPFGAVIMTLLGSGLGAKRFRSPAANVLCGAVAGMPLGVCSNCATPIGQGLLAGGASSRLTVAAMISSPSFNPVVLTMVFVLFPPPLAWARVLVPALLLVLLPVLVKENDPQVRAITMPGEPESALQQTTTFLRSFGSNLVRLFLLTLPWMILAAALGAVFAEAIPAYGTHLPVSALGVIAVAVLGTLLPVPMALDVALAFVLYRSGVPMPYVAALLCALGPLSVYSLSALAQQLGRSTALRLGAALIVLGSVAGWVAMIWPAGS